MLIVDDDPCMRMMVSALMRGHFEITVCEDAETGLLILSQDQSFDVLFTDFMLPGISGFEMVSKVRSTYPLPLRIVLMSAHNNYAMEARALAAGADVFLRKPFTRSQAMLGAMVPLEPAKSVSVPLKVSVSG
jgi:CheY-like chemotaxis protein